MAKPYLSLILPVRNEAAHILQSLLQIDYALSLSEFSSEVILVDDGSVDATVSIAEHFKKVLSTLRVVTGESPGGMGFAIKEGMAAARGNVRMVLFLPQCTDVLHARMEIIAAFRGGAEVVVGTRNRGMPHETFRERVRRIVRRTGNGLLCGGSLRRSSDVRFGMFAMTEDAALRVFSLSDLSNDRDILIELIAIAEANRLRTHEVAFDNEELCSCGGGAWDWVKMFVRAFRTRARLRRTRKYQLTKGIGMTEEDKVS